MKNILLIYQMDTFYTGTSISITYNGETEQGYVIKKLGTGIFSLIHFSCKKQYIDIVYRYRHIRIPCAHPKAVSNQFAGDLALVAPYYENTINNNTE